MEKLTDEQVIAKVKEITELEMPLEINKALKKLVKNSDYSLALLQKQFNFIMKSKGKDSDTIDTVDTIDTIDTKPIVSIVSYIKRFIPVLFNDTPLEQIIKAIVLSKRPLYIGEIALKTGKSEANVRNIISRNKVYFKTIPVKGKKSVIQLLQLALDELRLRVDHLIELEAQKKKAEDELKLVEIKSQSFIQEVKNYIMQHKLKRKDGFLIIDFNDISEYSPTLADLILDEPTKFLKQLREHYPPDLDFRLIHLPDKYKIHIEEIRKHNLNKLLVLEGRVTSLGEVKPVISEVTYECPSCGTLVKMKQNYRIGLLEEPKQCSCGRNGGFKINAREEINACFVQIEDLQENTDNPHSRRIKGVLFHNLCDPEIINMFTPGNEVKCVGILKEVPVMKGRTRTVFINWILELMNVELIEKEIEIEKFGEEELAMIKELSTKIDENGLEHLYESFAPEVHGYEEIKGAMILQLANRRNNPKTQAVRNKSNILMIGEPGVAKSVLGDFALKVSSGGRKAVGGGSSAVGITASVIKEEDSLGGYRVEPGAMILAKDVLFIDELNNLQDEDKPKLQEGMNEQRVSINKANLHVQMKVTCGIIAAANPIYGHFKLDDKLSIQDQFNIPTPILNRFDSIFVINDVINEENDKKIAKKMIHRQVGTLKCNYDIPFLKKFFAYIKHFPEPAIGHDTQRIFQEVYSRARISYNPGVKINPRFLESLTRMSISSAKIRQGNEVEMKDIVNAIKILAKTQYKVKENLLIETKIEDEKPKIN